MPKRRNSESERARQVLAQEAARIIVDHGVRDYRVAKQKAAERLGIGSRGSLPGNAEIEAAVADHLQIFGGESHGDVGDGVMGVGPAILHRQRPKAQPLEAVALD